MYQCQRIGSYSAVWQQITSPELLSLKCIQILWNWTKWSRQSLSNVLLMLILQWQDPFSIGALYMQLCLRLVYTSSRALSVWWMLMAWCLRTMASVHPRLTYTYLRHKEYPVCNGLQRFHKVKCNSTLLNQIILILMVMWFLSIHPATWVLFLCNQLDYCVHCYILFLSTPDSIWPLWKMLALKLYYLTSFYVYCHHIMVQFIVKIVSLNEDG